MNVAVATAVPLAACTVTAPMEEDGTLKAALKVPPLVVVMVDGVVTTVVPLNVIVALADGG